MSKIEWTGETWNPLVGCTIHSAGCKGCYAMKDAYRLMHNPHPAIAAKFAGTAKMVNGHAVWTGRINFDEATLLKPLKRRTPTTYFVNSMSDLFHQTVTDEQIDRIFAVMALCPQHTFQVLTKRADRMRAYMNAFETRPEAFGEALAHVVRAAGFGRQLGLDTIDGMAWPLLNVWLGVSVEDQRAADERIPDLLATPAAVRFVSCEPLIGPVDLREVCNGHYFQNPLSGERWHDAPEGVTGATDRAGSRIDWVICGGESGKTARPMHPRWARSLRDQCAAAGVPFFFKQWGEWGRDPIHEKPEGGFGREDGALCAAWTGSSWHHSRNWVAMPGEFATGHGEWVYRLGKKANGRVLDGVEHNGMPAVAS